MFAVFAFAASLLVVLVQNREAKGTSIERLRGAFTPEFVVCRAFVIRDDGSKTPYFTRWMSRDSVRTEIYVQGKRSVSLKSKGTLTVHDLVKDTWRSESVPDGPTKLDELAQPVEALAEIAQGQVVTGPTSSERDGQVVDKYEVTTATQKWTVWTDPKSKFFLAMELWERDPQKLAGSMKGTGHRLVLYEYPRSLPKDLFELKKP
ncbi:MAG: hypothetical protein JST30_05070 [Armatimonadetes bacterium]|nr:hypothetical protein [Armatimonadota bacterium]